MLSPILHLLPLMLVLRTSFSVDVFHNEVPHTNRSRVKRSGGPLDYGTYSTPEIIHSRGYPVEVHKVVTRDGYILEMHRIPGPRLYNRHYSYSKLPGEGRVVYIQHCVFCSSGDFVINDPSSAISFLLADAGFDVWLGNYRGNCYSRSHIRLSPEDKKFWEFSFMEMAHYDIPAMVYYILETTGHTNLSYIGHSMGTTGLFAALSMNPEMNSKIRVMAAMAPVAFLNHVRGPFQYIFGISKLGYKFFEKFNRAEVSPRTKLQALLAKTFCFPSSFLMPICEAIVPAFVGPNKGYINKNNLAVVLSHVPAGTSSRTLAHFGQLVRTDKFQMFDMGPEENLIHYGQVEPPSFDLSNVRIPVGLFWSDNDWVATPEDVQRTASELPNVILNYRVPQDDFNHLDFLFSRTALPILYRPMMQFLLDN